MLSQLCLESFFLLLHDLKKKELADTSFSFIKSGKMTDNSCSGHVYFTMVLKNLFREMLE